MRLSIVHYGKWSYPNNNDVMAPIFLNLSLYYVKENKVGGGDFSLYRLHIYAELLNNLAFKFPLIDLQNKW